MWSGDHVEILGRTAQQNGTGGTDHGHANVVFCLGGAVKGGKVYGKWPGMATEQLYQNRGARRLPTTSARFWVKRRARPWERATWS